MRLKLIAIPLAVILLVVMFPSSAFALNYSILAYDETSPYWYGTYADNYVDGSVVFAGNPNAEWDSIVNSVYVQHDELNGVEVGWSWDRYVGGTLKGPYMFTARLWNGMLSNSGSLGTCSKNT